MDDEIDYKRRRFMTNVVMGLAGAELYAITSFLTAVPTRKSFQASTNTV